MDWIKTDTTNEKTCPGGMNCGAFKHQDVTHCTMGFKSENSVNRTVYFDTFQLYGLSSDPLPTLTPSPTPNSTPGWTVPLSVSSSGLISCSNLSAAVVADGNYATCTIPAAPGDGNDGFITFTFANPVNPGNQSQNIRFRAWDYLPYLDGVESLTCYEDSVDLYAGYSLHWIKEGTTNVQTCPGGMNCALFRHRNVTSCTFKFKSEDARDRIVYFDHFELYGQAGDPPPTSAPTLTPSATPTTTNSPTPSDTPSPTPTDTPTLPPSPTILPTCEPAAPQLAAPSVGSETGLLSVPQCDPQLTETPTPTETPLGCQAFPIPDTGVKVRNTRQGPWEVYDGNVKLSIPKEATLVITQKSVGDATLWYYVEGYYLNGELVTIPDSDGVNGNSDGNWIIQRNILRLRKDEDLTQPYEGIILDNSEACNSLPWSEAPNCYGGQLNTENDTCSYSYDGGQAAAYAIAYAGLPNPNASPGNPVSTQYCTYNYGGINIGSCASPNRPLPPAIEDPDVTYNTDCANFTSIALWNGGLPMTIKWYCEGIPCASGGKSPSWAGAVHANQPAYLESISNEPTYVPTYVDSYLEPGGNPPPIEEIQAIREAWSPDGHNITQGDIVYVKRELAQHMMMVIGWGPILHSWDAIESFNTLTLSSTYVSGYVPYLVDHGPHGAREAGAPPTLLCSSCTKPRPYYALYWSAESDDGNYDLNGLWKSLDNQPHFIHIAETMIVPVEILKEPPISR